MEQLFCPQTNWLVRVLGYEFSFLRYDFGCKFTTAIYNVDFSKFLEFSCRFITWYPIGVYGVLKIESRGEYVLITRTDAYCLYAIWIK